MATFTVPGYRVDDLVSARGPAELWRGRTVDGDAPVALRRVHVPDPERLRGMRAESLVLAGLDHPHLLPVLDVVTLRDWLVVVQPWASGGSLADLLGTRQRLAPGEVITTFAPVAEALECAHSARIVHGAISAEHIVYGDRGFPMLSRLGMSASSAGALDPAAADDVLELGWLAVRALTGSGAGQLAGAGPLDDPAVLIDALSAVAVPESMSRALARALASPSTRATAGEFSVDLRASGTARPVALPEARPVGAAAAPAVERPDRTGVVHWVRVPPSGVPPFRPPRGDPPVDHRPPGGDAPSGTPGRGRHAAVPAQRPATRQPRPRGMLLAAVLITLGAVLAAGMKVHRANPAPARPGSSTAAALSTPTPGSSQSTAAALRAHGDEAFSALDALARVRSYAYQKRMPSLLHNVYDSAELEHADAAMLGRLVPVGCGLFGLNTSFTEVTVLAYSARSMTVRASSVVSPTTLVCGGAVAGRSVASGPRRMVVVLNRVAGRLEVAAESYR